MFAALNVLTGKVIGRCHGRHRHQEFLKFLRRFDSAFPPAWILYVVLDNYGTHKHAAVRKWLAAHPALSVALQADRRFVAELGRELVRQADAATPSARRLLQPTVR